MRLKGNIFLGEGQFTGGRKQILREGFGQHKDGSILIREGRISKAPQLLLRSIRPHTAIIPLAHPIQASTLSVLPLTHAFFLLFILLLFLRFTHFRLMFNTHLPTTLVQRDTTGSPYRLPQFIQTTGNYFSLPRQLDRAGSSRIPAFRTPLIITHQGRIYRQIDRGMDWPSTL